jgi:hypothetical protein
MITTFANYDFYNGTYKDDMGGVIIPQESFKKWAIKSSNLIRQFTFDNIDESVAIPEPMQYCCCELAEHLYRCEKRDTESDNVGIVSEKDGSWSATYESREKVTENDTYISKGIIYNWLADTGFLYCGVK